jgi:hypothetical protein
MWKTEAEEELVQHGNNLVCEKFKKEATVL